MKVFSAFIITLFISLNTLADSFNHNLWDQLLQSNVVELETGISTSVDYKAMAQSRATLTRYLNNLSAVRKKQFNQWSRQAQLAFLINAYNAWTIELILTQYPNLTSIKDLGGFFTSPWRKKFILLFGEKKSLNYIEHELIFGSKGYNKPRVHFALNCASKGCPTLRAEAYTGDKVEAQLNSQAQLFLSDFSRNRFNGKSLEVSLIFKWYKKDFENGSVGFNSLNDFFGLYALNLGLSTQDVASLKLGKINIKFLDYDWRLNDK